MNNSSPKTLLSKSETVPDRPLILGFIGKMIFALLFEEVVNRYPFIDAGEIISLILLLRSTFINL